MKFEGYKAGMYTRVEDYRAFILSKINYDWSWEDPKMNKLLATSSRELGELNAYSKCMPNMDIYIKMHMLAEACNSMKIDGSNINIEDNLLSFKEKLKDKAYDIEKMQNYVQAIIWRRGTNNSRKKS